MKSGADIHGPQRMKLTDFSDPFSFSAIIRLISGF